MHTLIAAFIISALIGAALTPAVRLWALRIGAVSMPGGRHHHGRTIPRLGGVAIFVAFMLPLLGLFLAESSVASAFRVEWRHAAGLLIGASLMCTVGFLDDTRRVRALYKLYAQIAAALIAWIAGFRIAAVALPGLGSLDMGVFALPVTVIWIVGITNAINLIDGLDGLAAGVVFFAALTNLIVAQVSGAWFVALLMAAVLGSVLGFLFHNFNPARIFMGDSGSYFLGFVLATTSLVGSLQKASTAISILVPILALGLPIFDTLFAMVRRFLERRPLFSPDRGHVHHRLLDMGLTHRRAVFMLYGVSLACTGAALLASLGRDWAIGGVLLFASAAVTGVIRFTGYFQQTFTQRRQKARLRSRHAELLRHVVPDLRALFDAARNEEAVFEVLREVANRAQLCAVELLDAPGLHEGSVVRSWTTPQHGEPNSPDALRARYPLGRESRAVASLRFVWHADYGEISPQEEVLLQVVVDVCARRLTQLGSVYAEAASSLEIVTPAPSLSRPTTAH